MRKFRIAPASARNTKVADNLVITREGIFQVNEELHEDVYSCNRLVLGRFRADAVDSPLPWHLVGVHRFRGVSAETSVVNRNEVMGKAMLCGKNVLEWRPEWLMSKKDQ